MSLKIIESLCADGGGEGTNQGDRSELIRGKDIASEPEAQNSFLVGIPGDVQVD